MLHQHQETVSVKRMRTVHPVKMKPSLTWQSSRRPLIDLSSKLLSTSQLSAPTKDQFFSFLFFLKIGLVIEHGSQIRRSLSTGNSFEHLTINFP